MTLNHFAPKNEKTEEANPLLLARWPSLACSIHQDEALGCLWDGEEWERF